MEEREPATTGPLDLGCQSDFGGGRGEVEGRS